MLARLIYKFHKRSPNRWKILYMEFCTRLDENHKNETVILTNQGRTAQAVLAKWCSGDKRFHQKSHTNIHFRSHKISWNKKKKGMLCLLRTVLLFFCFSLSKFCQNFFWDKIAVLSFVFPNNKKPKEQSENNNEPKWFSKQVGTCFFVKIFNIGKN